MKASTAGLILFACESDQLDAAVARTGAQLGQSVVRARSDAEALSLAGSTDFALVLVGYAGDAPGLLQTVALLRANCRSSQTPVVVLGLPPFPSLPLEDVYQAGAIAVLHDPVSPTILAAKARFYLDAFHTAAERRRAERALAQASERQEAILAAANLAVWEWISRLTGYAATPAWPPSSAARSRPTLRWPPTWRRCTPTTWPLPARGCKPRCAAAPASMPPSAWVRPRATGAGSSRAARSALVRTAGRNRSAAW